jgi:hypothetical protein
MDFLGSRQAWNCSSTIPEELSAEDPTIAIRGQFSAQFITPFTYSTYLPW